MKDTAQYIVLAALKLREGKPIAAAKFMGKAAEADDLELTAKTILRAFDQKSEVVKEEPSVELVDSRSDSYPVLPFFEHAQQEAESEEGGYDDPLQASKSEEDFEEYEHEEEVASDEADDEDDEDDEEDEGSDGYSVGGDSEFTDDADPEHLKAVFATKLFSIVAAAKKKKARRAKSRKKAPVKKQSNAAATGKKIQLTPRDT